MVCLAGLPLASLAPAFTAELTRSVRPLAPNEEMLPSTPRQIPPLAGADGKPLAPIRIAISDGRSGDLSALVQRDAAFEIVSPSANPELIWNSVSHHVAAGKTIVAYKVEPGDLAAVIDRTAALRALAELVSQRPQPLRVSGGNELRHKGDKVDIEVPSVENRALILFSLSGEGTVQALYPLGSDQRVLTTSPYRMRVQIHEPFGTDTIVAITASAPIDRLDAGLRAISAFHSAGPALRLILSSLPPDARIGTISLSSAP
jgi:hypothetical protein